ncbi:Cytochrome b/c1 [uncultured Alphaproteobacteria bacterium]|uniref:Cytochrome b n=1 Tax=uncultured Alphaproteobacteria bacterium TaxID=91750 RepID=A0A212JWY5_9PROT|nr:Cytochrome b/c1 [uncultured Alphaproteobacteria bacterium]
MTAPGRLNKALDWVDQRLPLVSLMKHSAIDYPTPKNLNYWWNFGSLAGFMLVVMIVTGLFLAMQYTPHVDMAFDSVERIMRDVNYGWLIRYLHMNGASMFFVVVYIHLFRGLYYGSYKPPRELLWWIGLVILLLMMATAFMGYVLPWGQMSLWGATVITNLFSAIPVVGEHIVTLLWGGFSVDNPTLNRFFVLHFLLPFAIFGVVILHVWALHTVKSNNPLGIDVKGPQDVIPFHPYYTVKDLFGVGVFLIVYCAFVFWYPNYLGHPDNYIPANPMVTPPHIVPEWYFLPFYAILRAVPDKLMGVIAMFAAILVLFALPWLDSCKVRSGTFRPWFKVAFWLFVVDCVILGYVGAMPAEGIWIVLGRIASIYYFVHLLVFLPLLSKFEKTRPLPESIGQPVLPGGGGGVSAAGAAKALVLLFAVFLASAPAFAAEGTTLRKQSWSWQGVFGTYDEAQLRRGYQVYREICAACHAMKLVHFRNTQALGFTEDAVKELAASYTVTDGPDDNGDMFERPAVPSDRFPSPFPNENAAKAANGGALPPDLSLIVKAREGGPDHVFSILTGFAPQPPDVELPPGKFYNTAFPGHAISMPPQLPDGAIEFPDGAPNDAEAIARDVTAFLQWAAEPELEERHAMGVKTVLFLFAATALMYALKRRVWAAVH